jgi:hypothetical protein
MPTKPNLKRTEFSTLYGTNEFDTISKDDESNSDTDYHISETESDDISTDEFISQNEDSFDPYAGDDDLSDSYANDDNDIFKHAQPEVVEKNGISYSSQKTQVPGCLRAINIL